MKIFTTPSYIIAGKYQKIKLKMNQIEFLNDKKTQLLYSNFKYQSDCRVRKDGSSFYRCVDYKEFRCPATLTILVEVTTPNHEHNHLLIFSIAAEYLLCVERLKQSIETLKITNNDNTIKSTQNFKNKYGRTLFLVLLLLIFL